MGGTYDGLVERAVGHACRAPSVHNTQPWRWVRDGDRVELWADRARALPTTDPDGRSLVLSCGAALHHLRTAAAALGLEARVERLPDPRRPDLLAVADLRPGHGASGTGDPATLALIERRTTDRRRPGALPLEPADVRAVAAAGRRESAHVLLATELTVREDLEQLVDRAVTAFADDDRLRAEQQEWTDTGGDDGVPTTALGDPQLLGGARLNRFRPGPPAAAAVTGERSDALLVVCTGRHAPRDWLRAGEALSALWLEATRRGLSVVPLSQVVEVPQVEAALQEQVLSGTVVPQLLVRLAAQDPALAPLAPTPRRPLAEVLLSRD